MGMPNIILPHLQALIRLGHQRVEEEFNDAALAGGDFGGDAHAWQQFELVLLGAFIVIQFNFSFINEPFLIVLNSIRTNIFNYPLQVSVTLEWIRGDFNDRALARFDKTNILVI